MHINNLHKPCLIYTCDTSNLSLNVSDLKEIFILVNSRTVLELAETMFLGLIFILATVSAFLPHWLNLIVTQA